MLTKNLTDLRLLWKQVLTDEGVGSALTLMKKEFSADLPRYNDLTAIEARLNDTNLKRIRGLLSNDELQREYNTLRDDLLTLIDSLKEADFSMEATTEEAKKAKTGHVLYRIPPRMELGKETRCVVRLSFEEASIIRNIELTDVTLKEVRVSETMEVELIDAQQNSSFNIRTVSSTEQFIERDDFTEWLFFVTPLREGRHPLMLKVTVLEWISNRERRKEMVLEELVVIVAEPVKEETEAALCHAGWELTVGDAPAAIAPATKSGSALPAFIRKYSLVLSLLLVSVPGLFYISYWGLPGLKQAPPPPAVTVVTPPDLPPADTVPPERIVNTNLDQPLPRADYPEIREEKQEEKTLPSDAEELAEETNGIDPLNLPVGPQDTTAFHLPIMNNLLVHESMDWKNRLTGENFVFTNISLTGGNSGNYPVFNPGINAFTTTGTFNNLNSGYDFKGGAETDPSFDWLQLENSGNHTTIKVGDSSVDIDLDKLRKWQKKLGLDRLQLKGQADKTLSKRVLSKGHPVDMSITTARGIVSIAICLDANGQLTGLVEFVPAGSSTNNEVLINLAIENIYQWNFRPSDRAKECGWVTYYFL